MNRVKGKRIAVIGAGSVGPGWGNGKAAAVLFAREGASVLCVDAVEDAAEETVSIIEGEGGRASALALDMTHAGAAQSVLSRINELWGGIDILHFNIGISAVGGVIDTSDDEWDRVFAVNLRSAMLISKAVLPDMRAQNAGALVFVSSLAATTSGPYSYVSYETSKAALCRLSKSIAAENAAFGVRSNTILPGMIDTPHVASFINPNGDQQELARERARAVPMNRQGSAWDVAHAALFLASDEAGYITGIDLPVDGGLGL